MPHLAAPRRQMRLRVWRPDVNRAGAGLAALAITAGLIGSPPKYAEHPRLFLIQLGVGIAFGILGAVLFYQGMAYRASLVDVEDGWNVKYDKWRNAAQAFGAFADGRYAPRLGFPDWRSLATSVPLPIVTRMPLRRWDSFLQAHENPAVAKLYGFALGLVEGDTNYSVGEFRRLGVRLYDQVWRLRAGKEPGFDEWMQQEAVRDGAEPLVVMLAYLEIANAARVAFEGQGDVHAGFWELAEEWHPNTMRLPSMPATPDRA